MKCTEFEKSIQMLIDEEIESPQRRLLEEHLTDCRLCGQEFANLQQVGKMLKRQPAILPHDSFDNRILQIIKSHQMFQPQVKTNRFFSLLVFYKPIFAGGLFAVGIGFAFLLGRVSVSSTSQPIGEITVKSEFKTAEKTVVTEPVEKIVTRTKFVTKYIENPVIKERVIEKKIFINNRLRLELKKPENIGKPEIVAGQANKLKQAGIAKQFNLKDLQPSAKVSYQIIRKGENNE